MTSNTQAATGKRIVRNSLFMFGQNAIVTVASLFITALIARHLGKEDYGVFAYTFAFLNLFYFVSAFGLRSVTVRAVAQNHSGAETYLGQMFSLRMILSLITWPALLAISTLLHDDRRILISVAIASGTLLFNALSTTMRDILQGFEKMSYEAMTGLVVRAVTFLGSLAAIFLGGDLFTLVWVYSLGMVASCIVPAIGLKRHHISLRPRLSKTYAKTELRKGLPFALNAFVGIFLARINSVLLGNLSTPGNVGLYSSAASIAGMLQAIPDAIATSIFPTVARSLTDPTVKTEALLQRVFFYLVLIGVPIGIGGMICGPAIMTLIYGSKFVEAIPIFQIAILTVPLEFLTLPANYALGAIHRQRSVTTISAVMAVANVILNFFLIPRFGAMGTVCAALTISTLYCIASHAILRRVYRVFADPSRYVRLFIAILAMSAALWPLRALTPFLSVPTGAATYLLAILVLRVLTLNQASDFLRQALGARSKE